MQTGKRVLITAAANGIGLAIARGFAAEGSKVHVCDINEVALHALKQSDPSTLRLYAMFQIAHQ